MLAERPLVAPFICGGCGGYFEAIDGREILHRADAGSPSILLRCPQCAVQSLCVGNIEGVHGEVVAPDDERWRLEWTNDIPVPNNYQYGACWRCGQAMRWDVELQRWVDLTLVDLAEGWTRDV